MPKRELVCPRCGSTRADKIISGTPTFELREAGQRGEAFPGGSIVSDEAPVYGCLACHYQWGRHKGQSLIPLITAIKGFVGGFLGSSYSFEADITTGQGRYEALGYGYRPVSGESKTKEIMVTREQWDRLLRALEKCDFEYWVDCYEDPDVLDGTHWEVDVTLNTGETIVKHGSNKFPGRWQQFCKAVSTLVGDTFR